MSINLTEDVVVRVSWLEEDGVLDVLERSFVQMMLTLARCCICEGQCLKHRQCRFDKR